MDEWVNPFGMSIIAETLEERILLTQPVGFLQQFGELVHEPVGLCDPEKQLFENDPTVRRKVRGKEKEYGFYYAIFKNSQPIEFYYQGEHPLFPDCIVRLSSSNTRKSPRFQLLNRINYKKPDRDKVNIALSAFPGVQPYQRDGRSTVRKRVDYFDDMAAWYEAVMDERDEVLYKPVREIEAVKTAELHPNLNVGLVSVPQVYGLEPANVKMPSGSVDNITDLMMTVQNAYTASIQRSSASAVETIKMLRGISNA